MLLTQSLIEEVYKYIKDKNSVADSHSIVHSDDLRRYVGASAGLDKASINKITEILHDCHKILSIEIVVEDKGHNIDKIEGFVVADLAIVRVLLNYYQEQVAMLYEKQFRKRLGIAQAIKELFPMLKSLNNTEIGQVANKAIMLNEYVHLLEKEYPLYCEEWQEKKLVELAKEYSFDYHSHISEYFHKVEKRLPAEKPLHADNKNDTIQRAVDSPEYKDYTSKQQNYPLQRIIKIYGMEFFLKIQMRKYEFQYLKQVVDDGQISNPRDLLMMKNMLGKVKSNFSRDVILTDYKDDINNLERSILHKMYFTGKK